MGHVDLAYAVLAATAAMAEYRASVEALNKALVERLRENPSIAGIDIRTVVSTRYRAHDDGSVPSEDSPGPLIRRMLLG